VDDVIDCRKREVWPFGVACSMKELKFDMVWTLEKEAPSGLLLFLSFFFSFSPWLF
jgi:hypothetical protein